MKHRRYGVTAVVAAAALVMAACGEDEAPDVNAAQQQFCTDVAGYVEALDTYGGLFEDLDLTVGDVRQAADDLDGAREAVVDSAAAFQEAVEADPTGAVTVELVEPESVTAVEEAEAAFDDAIGDVNDRTPVVEAAASFTAAAYGLQVAWVRAFADAGCLDDEELAQASEWVSDYVKALQTDLQAAGYYTGSVDGIFGPKTLAAVEALQEASGLPVTGLPDPATQAALAASLAGRSSAEIGALQGILITLGYFPGPIDGQWSPQLEEALMAFQSDLGVAATGVVDTDTLRAFEQALAEAGQPPATTAAPPPDQPEPTPPPATVVETTTTAPRATTTTEAPAPAPAGGILDVLADAGGFSELLAAIDRAGLTEMLSGPGPFTLFAPTDDAFDALAAPLPEDPAQLEAILLHHVVEDAVTGFELAATSSVATAQGDSISVSVDGGLIVLDGVSTVTISNVAGSNGLAHVVDAVLAPGG